MGAELPEQLEREQSVSLLGTDELPAADRAARHRERLLRTALYCSVMCINGGMVGAFGPSLECFQRSTGLGQGALGTSVLQNRLAKLAGTVVWAWYATALHSAKPVQLDGHTALALNLVLTAMGCAVLGFTSSGLKLEVVMVVAGFAYGITDSACAQLTLWVWEDDPRWQRGCVAVINACFTVGAFVTPMLVAASLHYLNDSVWPAFHILALCALLSACAAMRMSAPRPGRPHRKHEDHNSPAPEPPSTSATKKGESSRDAGLEVKVPGQPGSASKRKSAQIPDEADADAQQAWCPPTPRGEAEREAQRVRVFLIAVSTIGFFANGCEHAVATWLSSYGVHSAGLAEETMAIMTSNFWTAMSAGRIGWAFCSSLVSSAYPVLLFNAICCLLSTLLFSQASETMLLVGALGSGVGVSSSFPALVTLGPEARIEMTPRRMATLQLSASAGEMLCPFVLGVCFQFRLYHWFGPVSFVQQCLSLVALVLAYSWTRAKPHARIADET